MAYGTVSADIIQSSVPGVSLGAGNASIMKNRIINGAMVISQYNGTNSVTLGAVNPQYTLDRWCFQTSQASKISTQQNQNSVTPPVGFSNYLGITSLSAYSSGSSDYFDVTQRIEGFNTADLGWGTANAKTVTLSFWVQSSLTGTFSGALNNNTGGGSGASYVFTYSIPVANTWTQISVTVPGSTSGTWSGASNAASIYVTFNLGSGSSFLTSTTNSWTSPGQYFGSTGSVSLVGTNGATFYITGVQLEVGSSATGFEYRQYQQELALCQRYCYAQDNRAGGIYYVFGTMAAQTSSNAFCIVPYAVTMRATPNSVTFSAANTFYSDPSNANYTGAQIDQLGKTTGVFTLTGTSGLTPGYAGRVLSNNTAAAYVIWSAEL